MALLRRARRELDGHARRLVKDGHREAAQALWVLSEVLDDLIIDMAQRRRRNGR
jgi:hypothetical protein